MATMGSDSKANTSAGRPSQVPGWGSLWILFDPGTLSDLPVSCPLTWRLFAKILPFIFIDRLLQTLYLGESGILMLSNLVSSCTTAPEILCTWEHTE